MFVVSTSAILSLHDEMSSLSFSCIDLCAGVLEIFVAKCSISYS